MDIIMGESDSGDKGFTLQEILMPSPLPLVPSLPPTLMLSSQPPAPVTSHQPPVAPSLHPARELEPVTRPRKRRRDISPTTIVSEARMMRVSSCSEKMAELSPKILDQLERANDLGIPRNQVRPKVMNFRQVLI